MATQQQKEARLVGVERLKNGIIAYFANDETIFFNAQFLYGVRFMDGNQVLLDVDEDEEDYPA